jgi:serine protease AprX
MIDIKSQADKIGLRSLFKVIITTYVLILILINNVYAEKARCWIFFKSKGDGKVEDISARALKRRGLRGSGYSPADYDINPDQKFIERLKSTGLTIHRVSRWLNAASVSGNDSALWQAMTLEFVKDIRPVAAYRKIRGDDIIESIPEINKVQEWQAGFEIFDYGESLTQLRLCMIDSLHKIGYSGKDILIGMMDTGFDLDHPAFNSLISSGRLIAARDFINNDNTVQDTGIQQFHGTLVLSAIGGFADGSLIGAAYGAGFMLAKTENESAETQSEEDNWIAAAEWMEAQGVDIISSSVGYFYFVNDSTGYDQSDMDGNTAAITIAADIAASLGVIVINSAGNERNSGWGTIVAPADGDSVIAVGGVTSSGNLWYSSSPGPSYETFNRYKPDAAALASGAWAADYLTNGYRYAGGTSMAAPVVAGGLALILESHPDWDLDKVFSSLRMTASQADQPDTNLGWGIPNMFDMFAIDSYFTVYIANTAINAGDTIEAIIALFDSLSIPGGNHGDFEISIEGTAELIGAPVPSGMDTLIQKIYFPLPGPQTIHFFDPGPGQAFSLAILIYGNVTFDFAVAPNPAIDSVVFLYNLTQPANVEISIYNVAGDRIITRAVDLFHTSPGLNKVSWNAHNESNHEIATGIYIACLHTPFGNQRIKFAYVKD